MARYCSSIIDLKIIARVALEDRPQLLAQIGVTV
jgi:hypothetical protein